MSKDISIDRALVQRCLKNDQKAFAELLSRYRRPVYGIIRKMIPNDEEAMDLAQETFIRAFRKLDTFDQNRSFPNWLFRIATNLTIDFHRKRKLATVSLVQTDKDGEDERQVDLQDAAPNPGETFSVGERRRRLAEVIEGLPPGYRAVVVLRYQEDRSYDEIAEILEVPLGTVKARIHRAHRLLKEKLMREGFDWIPGAEA